MYFLSVYIYENVFFQWITKSFKMFYVHFYLPFPETYKFIWCITWNAWFKRTLHYMKKPAKHFALSEKVSQYEKIQYLEHTHFCVFSGFYSLKKIHTKYTKTMLEIQCSLSWNFIFKRLFFSSKRYTTSVVSKAENMNLASFFLSTGFVCMRMRVDRKKIFRVTFCVY